MIEDHFHSRLSIVEKKLRKIQTAPTVPIYSQFDLPEDAVTGQIAIGAYDTLNWFDGTRWWSQNPFEVIVGNVPQDVVEGQIVIGLDNISICWYSNGAWHGQTGIIVVDANLPQDAIEGQIVIGSRDDGSLAWYSDGNWYGITGVQ